MTVIDYAQAMHDIVFVDIVQHFGDLLATAEGLMPFYEVD